MNSINTTTDHSNSTTDHSNSTTDHSNSTTTDNINSTIDKTVKRRKTNDEGKANVTNKCEAIMLIYSDPEDASEGVEDPLFFFLPVEKVDKHKELSMWIKSMIEENRKGNVSFDTSDVSCMKPSLVLDALIKKPKQVLYYLALQILLANVAHELQTEEVVEGEIPKLFPTIDEQINFIKSCVFKPGSELSTELYGKVTVCSIVCPFGPVALNKLLIALNKN